MICWGNESMIYSRWWEINDGLICERIKIIKQERKKRRMEEGMKSDKK